MTREHLVAMNEFRLGLPNLAELYFSSENNLLPTLIIIKFKNVMSFLPIEHFK